MHADHIFGLPSVILHTATRFGSETNKLVPLEIYGPSGLYEYICTSLRLSESYTYRSIIVHEMMIDDKDVECIKDIHGNSPWRKPVSHYKKNDSTDTNTNAYSNPDFNNIRRQELHSVDGLWTLIDNERVRTHEDSRTNFLHPLLFPTPNLFFLLFKMNVLAFNNTKFR